ncbi:MAG: type II secretion system protein GspL [Gammaproteobacteria bacterium]
MIEILFLRIPDADHPASWQVVDAFGNRMGQPRSGTLAEAAPFAAGRRLRVAVPGSEVMLLHADIPTHNVQKILQAVPFALEDRLAGDIETQHFAVGVRDTRGYPVAVIARECMQRWLRELTAAGLKPDEIVPEVQTLPVRDHTLILVADGARLLARFPDGMAIAGDATLMPMLIRRHLAGLTEDEHCTHALIHADNETAEQDISQLLTGTPLEISYKSLNGGAIGLMAATAQTEPAINLLQGEFGLHNSVTEHWRRWRVAAVLLGTLALIFIVQQVVSEFSLRHEAAILQTQVTALFHQALPDVTRVVEPQVQMQQRLKRLTGGGGSTAGLLAMLAAVGTALQSQSGVQVQGFSYHGGSLQLQIQASSIQALDNMKSALAQNSAFHVDLDSVNASAGQTTGRLTLGGSGG